LEWEAAANRAREREFTEAQARRVVDEICQRAGLGGVEFTTIEQFLKRWLDSKEVTKSVGTTTRYRHICEGFIEHLGDRKTRSLGAITPHDVTSYRDAQITHGKSASTANMVVKTLRIALNVARRQALITTNPAEAVDLLPAERGERKTFSREQIKLLLDAADQEWRGMILFGACHGLRLGDAAKLTWANINTERRSLVFYPKKTARGDKRKAEEYPLHGDVQDYLASVKIKSNSPDAPLFPTLHTRKLNGRVGLSAQFRALMHKVKIFTEGESEERKKGKGRRFFELGFHSLRHTAISEMANRGVSKEVRMKLSGHKSNVHERYTHHELDALRKEIERVPSFVQ
jgi:integrase